MSEEEWAVPQGTELSLGKAVSLHLLPGILLFAFYMAGARLAPVLGVPTMFILYLGVLLVMIPFELGYMLMRGKKTKGRPALSGIVLFRRSMPWLWYIGIILTVLLWGFFLMGVVKILAFDNAVFQRLFSWWPSWLYLQDGVGSGYAKSTLLIFWGFYFICNISGVIVEELYFRGFLLPRLRRLGIWAPLLNTVLFSLYHFFTPEANVSRILLMLPWVYAVWWKRNVRIGIIIHLLANATGLFVMLSNFLK